MARKYFKKLRETKFHQGFFKPINSQKYKGDINNIVYRSSYELRFFLWADLNPDVISWGAETVIIPYRSPLDNRFHRYYIDLKMTVKKADGSLQTYLIEIKPYSQTIPPLKKEKLSKSYVYAVQEWAKNQAKWQAAKEYCNKNGYIFQLLTENELGIKK